MILVDVNIFMDALERRDGWTNSLEVINRVKRKEVKGFISALSIPILYFLRSRYMGDTQSRSDIKDLITDFEICALTEDILDKSFEGEISDFEDGIQFYSAKEKEAEIIVTRNKKDFIPVEKEIRILTPEEFIATS